ncbi:MAG: hypothetical protein GYA24_08835 [Candidatus Lokiarchaeota archaeon]|nr:hypothetical protein [Candidatus Lokiarchaeota archaeon]
MLEASRRVGYYIADVAYPNDPLNAGVTFFLHPDKSPSRDASDIFGLDEEDEPIIFNIPARTDDRRGITSFWTTLPGIGTTSDAFAARRILRCGDRPVAGYLRRDVRPVDARQGRSGAADQGAVEEGIESAACRA